MILAAEDVRDRVLVGFFLGELFRPAEAFVGSGAGAGAVELGVAGGLFVLRVSPVVPALRFDVIADLAIEIRDGGIRAPGTAEVGHLVGLANRLGGGGIGGGGVPRNI